VSNIDKYASYLADEDYPLHLLLADLRGQTPRTPAMERGHAFAKAMEQLSTSTTGISTTVNRGQPVAEGAGVSVTADAPVPPSGSDMLIAAGHAFAFTCDAEIEAWSRRELKAEKDYGGIIVSARCDRLHGAVIADDKSTSHFSGDAGVEKYIDKYQWRYYLDIFGAHEFRWHIWETREIEIKEPNDYPGAKWAWEVFAHHVVRNYRYPAMEEECRELAQQYRQFAEQNGL
jgi:hypothetical protein